MTSCDLEDVPTVRGAGRHGMHGGGAGATSWKEMDDEERLEAIDGFLAESEQFTQARRVVTRAFKRWRKGKDGRLIIVHGPSGSGKTTVADAVLEDIEEMVGGVVNVGATYQPGEDGEDGEEEVVDGNRRCEDGDEADDPETSATGRLPRTAGILREGPNGVMRPVVKVFVEPRTRSNRLLRDIVRGLGIKPALSATFGELVTILKAQIDGQGVQMIILDEVHHMVDGQGADVIKMLLVQARIQVVGIGLAHAKLLVSDTPDDDLERHLHAMCPMGAFPYDEADDGEWRTFLATLAEEMPFDTKPDFAEAGLSLRLHAASEGLVGKLMSLVEVAAEIAIDDGDDTIGTITLGLAYRRIHDTGGLGTPFDLKDFSAGTWKPVREQIRKRKALRKAVEARTGAGTKPSFKKR